jgi:hypothetical protein
MLKERLSFRYLIQRYLTRRERACGQGLLVSNKPSKPPKSSKPKKSASGPIVVPYGGTVTAQMSPNGVTMVPIKLESRPGGVTL